MLYQIDVMSRVPVYEQIIEQTRRFILRGILEPGDQIPSVRSLSAELSVNPNTIQKALAQLERQGLVFSVPGKGTFVAGKAKVILAEKKRGELEEIQRQLRELIWAGISREELLKMVNELFDNRWSETREDGK